ncbi:MAG: DUF6624 domain-containing protein [Bacteroidota bacterium]
MDYPLIAQKIIQLKTADLQLRDQLIQSGQLGKGYNKEMEALHNHNAQALDQIISKIGYPSIDKVGKEASEAAWLVIQHAISQPSFMKKCAYLLEQAIQENKANPIDLAYLSDRIAVFEGKHQRYGTHFDWDEQGKLSPQAYDDLEKVNQRRKALGLNTLEEQTAIIRQQAKKEKQSPPSNLKKRREEIDKWRKKVGWVQ